MTSKATPNLDTLIDLLRRDPQRNINLLHFIADNAITGYERIGDSLLVRGVSDRPWVFISSDSEPELKQLTRKLQSEDTHFAAVEAWMVPILAAEKKIGWDLNMMQFILPADVTLPQPTTPHAPLHPDDAPYVYENSDYQDYLTVAYIRDRIRRGPSAGIRDGDQLVAWTMTQDDGAIGALHVLESHRKKGYGTQVTLALCHQLRSGEKTPFAYVKHNNVKAINLVKKFGFVSQKEVHWLQLI